MLKKHRYVGVDFSEGETIWKYFPFPAFLALLEDGKLYFTRANCFADPNEFPVFEADAKIVQLTKDDYEKEIIKFKNGTFVNCWRLSDYESFGMWNAYADAATGVAIKSDVRSLFGAFNSIPENNNIPITAAKVDYIDNYVGMSQKYGKPFNFYYVALSKTKPYENEKELRLLYEDYQMDFQGNSAGFDFQMQTLIKEVYIGSSAKPYVKNLVESILKKRGINVPVIESIVK
ncbi:MAG: DUF2971 domain-containing protein [Salinivirgaceae bacterium]|nr:DUF2971 domain-containing protein [Salinivirgaceae bacterium]MBO7593550.1 DUF2971 domain-containing protein [Salinivirgaceae bacterium]